jgi:outer membrane immunogenic protein
MPVPALAMLIPISTALLLMFPILVVVPSNLLPALLSPIESTQAVSSVAAKSATIGSIPPLIVVGFEADIQGALERDTNNLSQPFSFSNDNLAGCLECTVLTQYTTQIDWFGTARIRIGYVWGNGEVMSYLTGGLAYGEVKINGANTVSGEFVSAGGAPFSVTQTFGQSHVNTGWVVGYGTEGVIDFWGSRNWTWKIEGLYMDLGTLDATGVTSGVPTVLGLTVTGGQVTTHSHFTDGILRAGLNYKFY